MSGKHGKHTDSPLSDGKVTEDDKFGYSESSTVDSGFISSGNLIVSGEISEEIIPAREEPVPQLPQIPQEEYMRLDSGVDLSESFSGLCLKSPELNDLSSCSAKTKKLQEPEPPVVGPAKLDDLWNQCFEQDEDGNTFLHVAITQGFVEMVLEIIRRARHPQFLDTPNDSALSPIHLAAYFGHWRVVRWLIVAGAKPSPRNITGDSPLHIAARRGDLNSCKAITDPVQEKERLELALSYPLQTNHQIDLNQWNYEGQTCVHTAAREGHVNVLRHLVWNGADINAREGLAGHTALHYAVQNRDERVLRFLLTECNKLQVDAVTYEGCSALQLGYPVASNIENVLRSRGVPSPYSSDDEYDDSSSDSEVMYENAMFVPNLVNAHA